MRQLIDTRSLTRETLCEIWQLVDAEDPLPSAKPVACSFEGTGTRTRTTFVQAIREVGLSHIDLPVFLETEERACDLAGYLDSFYVLYVIRLRDHERLRAFAAASRRPVINAMSAREHPCEAIADAHWFHTSVQPIELTSVVLWGPTTNVLTSWANVARAAGARVEIIDRVPDTMPEGIDLIVTDCWPPGFVERDLSLTTDHLARMGHPVLLPTPPFTIGKELAFDPTTYRRFAGYEQKTCLLQVQKAIIRHLLRPPG